jgi:dihydropteroate synthase
VSHFKTFSINLRGRLVEIDRPWVMGILNVTPDSFYQGSRCDDVSKIELRVRQLIDEGADVIDIGAYSTRPGAAEITADEEYSRLQRGLEVIHRLAPSAIVSVDTFRASVARRCVDDFGVDIINDVAGGTLDDDMFATVASLRVPYVLMHMRGTPATMQSLTAYDNVTADVVEYLARRIDTLHQMGVSDVIADPGFGFSKTVEQNYEMLDNLQLFAALNVPLLVGISRKSMIFRALDCTPDDALNGTTVLNTISLLKGAHILRVHDVKAAVEAVKLVSLTLNEH